MSYTCEKCGKKFKTKEYLRKHNQRKTPCNTVFKCEKCKKTFKNNLLLKRHKDRVTPCAPEEIPVITGDNEENKCHMCGNTYSNASNLKRHQKNCNVKNNPELLMQLLAEKDKVITLQQQLINNGITPVVTNINTTNNVTVNNIQQNLYVNVTICSFGKEDLSRLDTAKVMNLLKGQVKDFIPKMVEHVHANPDLPEYHNVFYDPDRKKAIVYTPISDTEFSWQSRDFNVVSAEITEKIKDHIRPGSGPYFDMATKEKDYETANKIPEIMGIRLDNVTEEFIQEVLQQVTKNKQFVELVGSIDT
jgi:hypothetical protein